MKPKNGLVLLGDFWDSFLYDRYLFLFTYDKYVYKIEWYKFVKKYIFNYPVVNKSKASYDWTNRKLDELFEDVIDKNLFRIDSNMLLSEDFVSVQKLESKERFIDMFIYNKKLYFTDSAGLHEMKISFSNKKG